MNKKEYNVLLKDPKWKKKRKEILNRDENKCVKCNSKNNLHVHHKRYILNRKPWEYDNFFLEVLCSVCHEKEHEKHISNFIISNKQSRIELSKNKHKINKKSKHKKNNLHIKCKSLEREIEMNDFRQKLLIMREDSLTIMNGINNIKTK